MKMDGILSRLKDASYRQVSCINISGVAQIRIQYTVKTSFRSEVQKRKLA